MEERVAFLALAHTVRRQSLGFVWSAVLNGIECTGAVSNRQPAHSRRRRNQRQQQSYGTWLRWPAWSKDL